MFTSMVISFGILASLYIETFTYKDINLPVLKTVGLVKFKKHNIFDQDKDYITDNSFNFNRANTPVDFNHFFKILEKKVIPIMRIEYSPNTRTIWKLKMRNSTSTGWEEVFSKINYISFDHHKRTRQITLNQPK